MKIYADIPFSGIDTFCSVLGKELIFESKSQPWLIIPCHNLGVYSNVINPEEKTKSLNRAYFVFRNVDRFKVDIFLYIGIDDLHLSGEKISYEVSFKGDNNINAGCQIEGVCVRDNSYSYVTYDMKSEHYLIIVPPEAEISDDYDFLNDFKNIDIHDFLLGKAVDAAFFNLLRISLENLE